MQANDNDNPSLKRELDNSLAGLTYLIAGAALNVVSSTNDVVGQLEKDGAKSGTVLVAVRQAEGRGRLKRKWYTEEGDLVLSLLLRPPFLPTDWSMISLMSAVAVVEGLAKLGMIVQLKWPNDLIVTKKPQEKSLPYFGGFRKIGGILVENVFCENTLSASIIGIGLNIVPNPSLKANVPHAAFIGDYVPNIKREDCLRAVTAALDEMIARTAMPNFNANLLQAYSKNCATLGHDVRVQLPDGEVCGRATALDSHGALIVHDGQREHIIRAGDVTFVR